MHSIIISTILLESLQVVSVAFRLNQNSLVTTTLQTRPDAEAIRNLTLNTNMYLYSVYSTKYDVAEMYPRIESPIEEQCFEKDYCSNRTSIRASGNHGQKRVLQVDNAPLLKQDSVTFPNHGQHIQPLQFRGVAMRSGAMPCRKPRWRGAVERQ